MAQPGARAGVQAALLLGVPRRRTLQGGCVLAAWLGSQRLKIP